MRKKIISDAKFIITVESNKKEDSIETVSVFDNRSQEYMTEEYISERGIQSFLDIKDLKETLNWNLNGDSAKYQFKWGQSTKYKSEGRAYIFH
jgi:hypothetical protein